MPEFTAVTKLAAESSCSLVLADIEGLLRRTKPDLITRCLDALGACVVPVIDAKTNRDWHFISGEEKTRIAATAMNVFADRSVPIRQSLGKSRSAVPRPPGKGHRVGARVNAVNADKRASELATFAAALRARLPEGVALSPAGLARALNGAGIKTARAAKWTYQTAKDLLKRIDALQKTTD